MKVTIFNETEIRTCAKLDLDSLEAVTAGFSKLAKGEATLPPIMRIDIPENHGEVDVKTAYIHGLENFAIKIASGFYDNQSQGLPFGCGMMVVFSAKTGFPKAILLDNGYLTDLRTGLAGAIAAKYIANENINTVGIIGAGTQGRYQIKALKLVRNFTRLLVYSIIPEEIDIYVTEMTRDLGVEVIKYDNPEPVVRQSDLVVTATPAHKPYLRAEWLHPGMHITCIGADTEDKQEIYEDVFSHVDIIVCDSKIQCFRLGELHHALLAGAISNESEIIELGELTSGMKTGRQNKNDISICDLTGVGVQDTAIALLAYERAIRKGFGVEGGN
jgi:ectoine utilization protein EutC